jgi:hypothetical protein
MRVYSRAGCVKFTLSQRPTKRSPAPVGPPFPVMFPCHLLNPMARCRSSGSSALPKLRPRSTPGLCKLTSCIVATFGGVAAADLPGGGAGVWGQGLITAHMYIFGSPLPVRIWPIHWPGRHTHLGGAVALPDVELSAASTVLACAPHHHQMK